LIKLVLLPFSLKGEQSMKKQREFQKKIAYLQQKHKANPELLNEERNELMRKQGVGGMIGGCLPILLQIPIFFALNKVLSSSFELYQAPMLWIPDLSATDPYYILPVLVAIVMVLNAIISSDSQQMITGLVMALVFGAISASFSAGLALYLGTSVLAGIIQTKVLRMLNIA
jgi:YidC/Oxa1 family membrane protein insertase